MDRTLNPYAPGSGLRPPAMEGRNAEIETFAVLLQRAQHGLHNRGMVLSGLRGVGKTVLLNHLRASAEQAGWVTVYLEGKTSVSGQESLRSRLARELVTAARRLNKPSMGQRWKAALETIASFSVSVGVTGATLGVETHPGRADTGQMSIDIEELVEDISLAMRDEHAGFAMFIDEMQDLDDDLLSALIAAQHAAGQRDWPFYVIGAGLPNLPSILSASRSYAERLFDYRRIGPLSPDAARAALSRPAQTFRAGYTSDALDLLVNAADGYPYFLQEYGRSIWDLAPEPLFTATDAELAIEAGKAHLDSGFFPSRWDRATKSERLYLRAMTEDGAKESSTTEIARRLNTKPTSLAAARAQLLAKGLIYSPDHGKVAFTVPGMPDYIRRQHND